MGESDALPLMVMERLPGEQLRTVLAGARDQNLKKPCASLGASLATFHNPVHLAVVPKAERGFGEWLYSRTMAALQEIASEPRPSMDDVDTAAVRRCVDARLPALAAIAIPSLVKADRTCATFLRTP